MIEVYLVIIFVVLKYSNTSTILIIFTGIEKILAKIRTCCIPLISSTTVDRLLTSQSKLQNDGYDLRCVVKNGQLPLVYPKDLLSVNSSLSKENHWRREIWRSTYSHTPVPFKFIEIKGIRMVCIVLVAKSHNKKFEWHLWHFKKEILKSLPRHLGKSATFSNSS